MVYIQVWIPYKNKTYDFKVPTSIDVATLKSLILEAVYEQRYDYEFVRDSYMLFDYYDSKRLQNDILLKEYAIHNGEKFLLI